VLAIVGAYWLEPDAKELATPAQALARLRSGADGRATRKLYGNYAYVLHDPAAGRTTAECGDFGVVPLYYTQGDDGLGVATDIKFLAPIRKPALDAQAAGEFLQFGHLMSDLTLLEGVRRLLPGTRLVVEGKAVRLETGELPHFRRDSEPSAATYDVLDAQFERAISRYAPDLQRASVSLSGGLDSRTTLLAAMKVGMPVDPWTAGEPGSLECDVARKVCARENLAIVTHSNDCTRLPTWFERSVWFTEARCPPGHMHFLDAGFAGAIAGGGQLHGLVGDVVVGGDYDTQQDVPTDPQALRAFCGRAIGSLIYWPADSWQRLGLDRWIDARQVRERVTDGVLTRSATDDPYSTYLWSRYQHRGFGFIIPALVSQVAPWADVMTPFIDPAFFATCASIDRRAIAERKTQLAWSARRYPQLIATPRVKDGVLLPLSRESGGDYDGAIKRLRLRMQVRYLLSRLTGGRVNLKQRESYPFYANWYRKSSAVREYFRDVLLSERSLSRGLWSREGIERLLHDLRVGRNVWDAIGTILMLEVFIRLFIEGAGEQLAE